MTKVISNKALNYFKLHEMILNKALILPSGLHPRGKFKENV